MLAKYILLVAATAAGFVAAQEKCTAQANFDLCMKNTQTSVDACGKVDYKCLCKAQKIKVDNCFPLCPNDPSKGSQEALESSYCTAADQVKEETTTTSAPAASTPTTTPVSGGSSEVSPSPTPSGTTTSTTGGNGTTTNTTGGSSTTSSPTGAGMVLTVSSGMVGLVAAAIVGLVL